ncbi:hypothetical protein QL285_057269 [Trifolium repens]|nr:hypothetical protein QL285_057269 [Trifolium repens]
MQALTKSSNKITLAGRPPATGSEELQELRCSQRGLTTDHSPALATTRRASYQISGQLGKNMNARPTRNRSLQRPSP